MIEIRRYESDLLLSNMYVVVDGNHAVVIDPFEDTSLARELVVDYIFLTHEHYDHISGVNSWKKERNVPVFCSRRCAENIQNPKKNLAYYFREFCELQTWIKLDEIPLFDPSYSCQADQVFDDEVRIEWAGHIWHLFELPGHSMGSCGIILDESCFFSGDSLIENCEIALRIPGGSKKKWNDISVPKLKEIPKNIHVYPGHFKDFDMAKVGCCYRRSY